MRKIWVISIIAFVFLAMAACAGMYQGGQRVFRSRGTVAAYEPGKMIKLAEGVEFENLSGTDYVAAPGGAPQDAWVFAITPATEVKGEIKPGIRVLIRYTQLGSMSDSPKTAVSIDAVWSK